MEGLKWENFKLGTNSCAELLSDVIRHLLLTRKIAGPSDLLKPNFRCHYGRLIKNTWIRLRESKNEWISSWAIELAQKWVNEKASKPVSRWLSHYICGWASWWVILPNNQDNECMSDRVRKVLSIWAKYSRFRVKCSSFRAKYIRFWARCMMLRLKRSKFRVKF